MRVIKCDWCGTETQNTAGWLKLTRPSPLNDVEHGIYIVGGEELDFCSEACVWEKMNQELDR